MNMDHAVNKKLNPAVFPRGFIAWILWILGLIVCFSAPMVGWVWFWNSSLINYQVVSDGNAVHLSAYRTKELTKLQADAKTMDELPINANKVKRFLNDLSKMNIQKKQEMEQDAHDLLKLLAIADKHPDDSVGATAMVYFHQVSKDIYYFLTNDNDVYYYLVSHVEGSGKEVDQFIAKYGG